MLRSLGHRFQTVALYPVVLGLTVPLAVGKTLIAVSRSVGLTAIHLFHLPYLCSLSLFLELRADLSLTSAGISVSLGRTAMDTMPTWLGQTKRLLPLLPSVLSLFSPSRPFPSALTLCPLYPISLHSPTDL